MKTHSAARMKFIVLTVLVSSFIVPFVLASEQSLNRTDYNCSGRAHHNVTMSAYYADYKSDLESDYLDARLKKLRNLQDYIDGRAEFVTVSMDLDSGIPYGTKMCIPELNAKFRRQIALQARDKSRLDNSNKRAKEPDYSHVEICVRTEEDTYDNSVNGIVTLYI